MTYTFKPRDEAIWLMVQATAVAMLQFIVASQSPDDWRVWASSLAVASLRALAGAALSQLGPVEPKG